MSSGTGSGGSAGAPPSRVPTFFHLGHWHREKLLPAPGVGVGAAGRAVGASPSQRQDHLPLGTGRGCLNSRVCRRVVSRLRLSARATPSATCCWPVRGPAQPPHPDGCGGAGEPGEGASVQAPAGARAGARAVSSPLRLPRRQLLTMLARERPREPETRPSLREKAFPPRGPSAPSRTGVGRARCKFLRLCGCVCVPSTDHVKTIVFH